MNNSNNNTTPTEKFYLNTKTDRSSILSDNKGRAGIYKWEHIEFGKIYIGSSVDISQRLKNYFTKSYLIRNKTAYICNALLCHGFSAFSLTILEYIDITDKSKDEAKNLILSREQHFIDSLSPDYNISLIAGSLLGYLHTEGSKKKMSEAKSGVNHPLFGRTHSAETKEKMSKAHKGKSLSTETKAKLSKPLTEETKAKMSISKGGGTIFVYDSKNLLINTFGSTRKAAEFFKCSHVTIAKYVKNRKLFKEQWVLSTSSKL